VKPYYEDDAVTIYHGDCRDILPTLTFDAIVTDPPYGIEYSPGRYRDSLEFKPIVGDDENDLGAWIANHEAPRAVFGADNFAHRLPPGGTWTVWDKRVVESADRIHGSPFEMVWIYGHGSRKRRIYRIQHCGAINADGQARRVHPTQKPVVLMKRIINDHFPTGVIADPFMGAGSTLRAAKDLGRRAVGIEIEERYCEAAVARLAQEVLSL
tara:strand:- start:104 stop:736 length:633 start_codon:yes stop_codon:yes gene_type:complete